MMTAAEFRSIVEQYVRHGWVLRRVLLSESTRQKLADHVAGVLGEAPVVEREFDAAWFSRPPADGTIAWEIRNLGDTPYALVEHLDEGDPQFENALRLVEERLVAAVASRRSA